MRIITTLHALDIIDICNEFQDPFGLERDGGADIKKFTAIWLTQELQAIGFKKDHKTAEVHLGCMEGDLVTEALHHFPVKPGITTAIKEFFSSKIKTRPDEEQAASPNEGFGYCFEIGAFHFAPIPERVMSELMANVGEVVIVNLLDTAS